MQPTSADDCFTKLAATGLTRVQIALDPIRGNAKGAWTGFQRQCATRGITCVSGVISTVGENDSLHLNNVTGVYTMTTFERMIGYIKTVMPSVKKIGTLFSTSELNATYYKSQLIAAASNAGIQVETFGVGSRADISLAAQALCGKGIDAVCQIEDNLTSAAFPVIAQTAKKYKLPVFSFVNSQIHSGSCMVFAPDYYGASRETAKAISQILNGKSPGEIPFKRINKFFLFVNLQEAESMNLKIPDALISQADSVFKGPGKP